MKEVSALNIKKLVFKNFKTLEEVSFEPGRVNVFIGANGSGKTTILEAIGLLCAAMTDRVETQVCSGKVFVLVFRDFISRHSPI